jgi:acetyl/propionyl-CoA carboxylase alpha subunit
MVTGQLWLDRASSLQVSGLSTNVAFLRALCQHPAFQAAELDTSFIAKHMDTLMAPAQPDASVLALAAVAWHLIAVRVGHCCISGRRPCCENHKQRLLSRYM